MERPGRVLSRAQLLDLVWGHNVYVEERTVDVHMSRLRKAINQPSKNGPVYSDLIRTVRGSGYALKAPQDSD
jgi:two-component system phosphate regulon response regulator PhoB